MKLPHKKIDPLYKNKIILLKNPIKKAKVIKKVNEKWLCEWWDDDNILKYKLITEEDVLEEESYNIIKERNNKINKILNRGIS